MTNNKNRKHTPFVLLTMDGWGVGDIDDENLLNSANTPYLNKLMASYPSIALDLTGDKSAYDNEKDLSELGYYSIGTGKDNYNPLSQINKTIQSGEFFKNSVLKEAFANARKNNSSVHLLGLVSKKNKHSSLRHIEALLDLALREKFYNVNLHLFLDGVEDDPRAGLRHIQKIKDFIKNKKVGKIATVSGRFYAMDRNNFYEERISKCYIAMVEGGVRVSNNVESTIKESYEKQIFDKEFLPTAIKDKQGDFHLIGEGDSVIFFNFRAERARELTKAFTIPGLEKIPERKYIKNLYFATFTNYEKDLPVKVAFPIPEPESLPEKINKKGMSILRIGDINKYNHIKTLFNGDKDIELNNDKDIILDGGRKDFNLNLMDSTEQGANFLIKGVKEESADFFLVNLANIDLSAQVGNYNATLKYVELADKMLKKICKNVLSKNGVLIITSTAGLTEGFTKKKNIQDLNYTFNPVPVTIVGNDFEGKKLDCEDKPELINKKYPYKQLSSLHYTILKLLDINDGNNQSKTLI